MLTSDIVLNQTISMLRYIFLTGLLSAVYAAPAHGKSSKRIISFASNVEGATVTVQKYASRSGKTLDSCETPCQLNLNPSRMGTIVFSHPGYSSVRLPRVQYTKNLTAATDNNIRIEGDLGLSIDEHKAAASQKYQAAIADALAQGKASPKVWKRIPPKFPRRGLENGRSAWCQLRLDVRVDGSVENVDAYLCSEKGFREASEASVAQWQYIPGVRNSDFEIRRGEIALVTFAFRDGTGKLQPPLKPRPSTKSDR